MTEHEPRRERIQDLVSEGVEVVFNPTTLLFESNSGGSIATFTPDQPRQLRQYIYKTGEKPTGNEFIFALETGNLVIMPNLRKFLAEVASNSDRRNTLRRKVSRVMEEVADGKTLGLWTDDEKFSLLPHRLTDVESRGLMRLETVGACACYRTEMSGFSVRSPQPEVLTNLSMPIGMSPHNIESDLQRKTVLAGAASVAWFAKNGFEANTGRSSAADHIDS
ncbi:MAG: hypothetical protein E6Q89_08675 [Bacteroidia bacterium]|nr:MAG: hypothetical protein E6Q89_08675 [Bacteroidia bacterium]